jgi:hypothetical protein
VSEVLVTVHSVLRWLVLAALLGGGAYALLKTPAGGPFHRLPFSLGAGVVDLQVAIGVALYFLNDGYRQNPFIAVIHPVAMVLALGVVHLGVARAAARGGGAAYRTVGVAFLSALVVVALGIPWQR